MKKIVASLLTVVMLFTAAATVTAADGGDIPDDTPITYGYLEIFREQLKKEIIAELREEGVGSANGYEDISLTRGSVILLGADCEVIFRGGSASALASSAAEGDGLTDISVGGELFSGDPLSFGHIYRASASDAEKAILVTGGKAYFTLNGSYEIR